MSIVSDILSIIAIFLTIGQLIYLFLEHFLKKRTINPTIEISVENVPPYQNPKDETLILLKNIGTSIAYEPYLEIRSTYFDYSIKYKLDQMISIGETIEKKVRLPEDRFDIFERTLYFTVLVKTRARGKDRLKYKKDVNYKAKR